MVCLNLTKVKWVILKEKKKKRRKNNHKIRKVRYDKPTRTTKEIRERNRKIRNK